MNKKILALCLACLLMISALLLASCGDDNDPADSSSTEGQTVEGEQTSETDAQSQEESDAETDGQTENNDGYGYSDGIADDTAADKL
ncbi:MAG: hypothetical protein IJY08_01705 [Clostridia bacterium]|nr:hypothetical protein [Clostridia bacterium]